MPELAVIVVCFLILAAEFVNGFHDAANAIATVVSTRVLKPPQALGMAVFFNVIGAMSGTAVAFTIGKGIVDASVIDISTIAAAMLGVIIWNLMSWFWGLPTSTSHALVAALTGAGLAKAGPSALLWHGWEKVFVGLLLSTFLGFSVGWVMMMGIYRAFAKKQPRFFKKYFGKIQLLSSAFMAFGHGTNDGQKFIGMFTLALLLGGTIKEFHITIWTILICAAVMGLGTAFGGWRIIRTMGLRLAKLEPVHGFAAETGAALGIQLATHFGIPISTTHIINTSIMGVGATRRFSGVKWGVGKRIVLAWVFTFPISGVIAFVLGLLFKYAGISS